MKTLNIKTLIKDNWGFALILLMLFASRSSLADWYHVPSGSMLPTIEVGDRILVNKMAYRLELPFTDISLVDLASPERGDIVVFVSEIQNERLVKRIVGLPGDKVSMANNQLTINGQIIKFTHENEIKQIHEHLLGGKTHAVQFLAIPNVRDTFAEVTVPQGEYLVLGDNRNNSIDSRYYGFVPAHEIQGKAIKVMFSLDPNHYYAPKTERFFSDLI